MRLLEVKKPHEVISLIIGSYEKAGTGYKHVYFNVTSNTLKIWGCTILAAIVTYECICRLVKLALDCRLRISMLVLFISAIYPHYYGWWMYFNAWNDEFYMQFNHQAFFTLTEISSTAVVLYLCDLSRDTKPRLLLVIACIALTHILLSCKDQFVINVLRGGGKWHQWTRDLGFMIPDLLHLIIPVVEMARYMHKNKLQVMAPKCLGRKDLFVSAGSIIAMIIMCAHL